MTRRTFLSKADPAVVVAATAGRTALGLGEDEPIRFQATQAAGDETDVHRRLIESLVADRPPPRKSEVEPTEQGKVGVTGEIPRALFDPLQRHGQGELWRVSGPLPPPEPVFIHQSTPHGTSTVGLDGGNRER